MKLLIGEVSKIFGISTDTLRYYDKIGILKSKMNPNNNYRYYSMHDLEKLGLIIGIKELGVPLADIKKAIENESLDGYKELLESQKEIVLNKIKKFKKLKIELDESTQMIEEVQALRNEYNFEALGIFYKRFNIYSINMKNILALTLNAKKQEPVKEITTLNYEIFTYIYNLKDGEAIEDEEEVFLPESKMIKKLLEDSSQKEQLNSC